MAEVMRFTLDRVAREGLFEEGANHTKYPGEEHSR